MDAAGMRFDASRWVGRGTRTRIRAVSKTLEMLESSLDRTELRPAAPMPHWRLECSPNPSISARPAAVLARHSA